MRKYVQLAALCMIYLILNLTLVQALPVYEPPNQGPRLNNNSNNVTPASVANNTNSTPSYPGPEPEAPPNYPTSPYGANDAEAPPNTPFSPDRGAYAISLDVDVPRYLQRPNAVFTGKTNAYARVRAYVDPQLPISPSTTYTGLTIADDLGDFSINVQLQEGTHHLVFVAEGREQAVIDGTVTGNHTVTKEYDVTIDLTPPQIELNPKIFVVEGNLILNGTTSEDTILTATIGGTVQEEQIPAGPFQIRVPMDETTSRQIGQRIQALFTFADQAGNDVQLRRTIRILGAAPQLFNHNLDQLTPSYVQKVLVKGNATPGSTVFIAVNGETTPGSAWSTSLYDLVTSLPVRTTANKEYTATAADDGSFAIEVLLTKELRENMTQYLPGDPYHHDLRGVGREYDTGSTFENRLEIFVIDEMNRSTNSGEVAVVFARCGSGSFWDVTPSDVTPTTVIPEHLREGLAQLGLNFQLKWRGPSDSGTILSTPQIRVLKQNKQVRTEYAFDPQKLVRKPIQSSWNDDYTVGGTIINFNKLPYIQKNLSDITAKDDLFIKIPLQMEINFEYDDYHGEKIRRTQLYCTDVITTLDIEFDERWLPSWLLKDSIEFFEDSIEVLNRVLEYLKYVLIGTFVTCLGGWVSYYYKLVVEKMNCSGVYSDTDPMSQEKIDCAQAMQERQNYEKYMKWICDRVYCPSAPNLGVYMNRMKVRKDDAFRKAGEKQEKYSLSEGDVDAKISACGIQEVNENAVYDSAMDYIEKPTNLKNILKPFDSAEIFAADDTPARKCAKEYINQYDSVCWFHNEFAASACLYDIADGSRTPRGCGGPVGKAVQAASTMCEEEVRPVIGSVRFGGTLPAREVTIEVKEGINGVMTTNKKKVPIRDRWFRYMGDGKWEVGTFYADRTEKFDESGKLIGYERGEDQFFPEFPRQILTREEAEKYGLVPKTNKDYVIDPTAGVINSFRCLCLPAINTYLAMLKKVFSDFKQCFETILLTGKGSTGMCRRAFSETLCDFIIDAIKCFAQRYGAGHGGARTERQTGISGFIKAVSSAGEHMQTTITERYGKSNLYKMLNERTLVHSACFYAFTGDFDIDIEGALTGIGTVPVASEGFLYPKQTRRFMSANPVTGNARFIYHGSGGLVAGGEVKYGVELICTASPTDCKQIYGFAGNKCDCTDIGEKRYPITNYMGTGVLSAGQSQSFDAYVPMELPYRFDRIRMYWEWRDNNGDLQTGQIIEEIKGVGDEAPASCSFRLTGYRCETIAGQQGRAAFLKRPRPLKSVFLVNDNIDVEVELEKYSPNNQAGSIRSDVNAALQLSGQSIPFYVVYQLRDQNGNIVPLERYAGQTTPDQMAVRPILEDGLARFTIPGLQLKEELLIRGMSGSQAGYAKTVQYTNDQFREAHDNKIPLRSAPSLNVAHERRENLAFGMLLFKTEDAGGNERYCYGIERASVNESDYSKLTPGHRNYQFVSVGGAIPCTETEIGPAKSGLAGTTSDKLLNNVYLLSTDDGIVEYRGVKIRPDYGLLEKGKLYSQGFLFLPPRRSVSTECRDITVTNPAEWKLHMWLKKCKTREADDVPNVETCVPSDVTVRFGGKRQEFAGADAIKIPVACEETRALNTMPDCPTDRLVRQECQCRGTAGAMRCGYANGLNYCTESGHCIAYEACVKMEDNFNLHVDPSNDRNMCDCNGRLALGDEDGDSTDMECGFGNYCAKCPGADDKRYACVPEKNYFDTAAGKAKKDELCPAPRVPPPPPAPIGPVAPPSPHMTPPPPTGENRTVRYPFAAKRVTLGKWGPVTINPGTECGPDDNCKWYGRAATVRRPKRSLNKIDKVVLHITTGGSAQRTYEDIFFKGKRGKDSIGTHYLIRRNGEVMQVENENIITYHALSANTRSIGIDLAAYAHKTRKCAKCIDGADEHNTPHAGKWKQKGAKKSSVRYWEPITDEQHKSTALIVADMLLRHGMSIDDVWYHGKGGRPFDIAAGKVGYACEGFAPNKPHGISGKRADPGVTFDWCGFKAAVMQAMNEYGTPTPFVAVSGTEVEKGRGFAKGFHQWLQRSSGCGNKPTPACLELRKANVETNYYKFLDLCNEEFDCEQGYDDELKSLVGSAADAKITEIIGSGPHSGGGAVSASSEGESPIVERVRNRGTGRWY